MVTLLSTILTCNQAMSVIYRVEKIDMLTDIQKTEIIQEIYKVVPFCSIAAKSYGK